MTKIQHVKLQRSECSKSLRSAPPSTHGGEVVQSLGMVLLVHGHNAEESKPITMQKAAIYGHMSVGPDALIPSHSAVGLVCMYDEE